MEQQPPVLEVRRVTKPPALAGVTPAPSMLRRDGLAVDVLEGLPAPLVRARVRSLTTDAIHEDPAPRAGSLRFAGRTITGQPVTITALEHRAITDEGGESPVERSHRHAGALPQLGVGERPSVPQGRDHPIPVPHVYTPVLFAPSSIALLRYSLGALSVVEKVVEDRMRGRVWPLPVRDHNGRSDGRCRQKWNYEYGTGKSSKNARKQERTRRLQKP